MADKFQGGIKAGSTDVSLTVGPIRKTADSTEKTTIAAADVTASYWRQGGSRTAITVSALAAIDSAHSDGGWKEVDATNMPGKYRFDLPDAAVAIGADWVEVALKVGTCFLWSRTYILTSNVVQTGDAYGIVNDGTSGNSALHTDLADVHTDLADVHTDLADVHTDLADVHAHVIAIGGGSGSVAVNHNTGGADNLAYKTAGDVGIDNAVVRAYLKSDYDAGNRGEAFIKGWTRTNSYGRWVSDLYLDPATYTFVFEKQEAYGPNTKEMVVS